MNKIVLRVDDIVKSFQVEGVPTCERDLIKYKEYMDFCYSIGLGAPVTAEVTESTGWFGSKTHRFSYTMRGNSISLEELQAKVDLYAGLYECEVMQTDPGEGTFFWVYSFKDNSHAYNLYRSLERICNVGVRHGRSQELGKYVVAIDFRIV